MYAFKYETYGKFWPIVHNLMVFSLVLMHVIAIGIFELKELPLASVLTVPLPILTLLFNEYCKRRFLPLFKAYPAEVNSDTFKAPLFMPWDKRTQVFQILLLEDILRPQDIVFSH